MIEHRAGDGPRLRRARAGRARRADRRAAHRARRARRTWSWCARSRSAREAHRLSRRCALVAPSAARRSPGRRDAPSRLTSWTARSPRSPGRSRGRSRRRRWPAPVAQVREWMHEARARDARRRDREPRRPPRRRAAGGRLAPGLGGRRRPLRRRSWASWSGSSSPRATDVAARGGGVRRRGRAALPEHLPRQPRVRRRADVDAAVCATPTGSRCARRSRASSGRRCTTRATRAYLEVHIEQGPVLEAEGLPLGVVTAIAGQSRFNLVFAGRAGPRRDDADAPAPRRRRRGRRVRARGRARRARRARAGGDRRGARRPARRGQRDPGARRGHARHPPPGRRRARPGDRARCARETDAIARAPRRARDVVDDLASRRRALHAALVERVAEAVAATGVQVRELPSGAGHDAVTMARVTDIAMLFVRCAGGISHHPDESVDRGRRRPGDRSGDAVRRGLFDLIVRGGTVVTPAGRGGGHRRARRRDRRGRARAAGRRASEIDARGPARPARAGWTRTCTSTSPAARTGRGSRPAARRWPPAASRRSSTCR